MSVTLAVLVAALAAGLGALLCRAPAARPTTPESPRPLERAAGPGWLIKHRLVWSLLAGVGAWAFLGGTLGLLVAPAASVGAWVVISRAEAPQVRQRREQVARELPHVVTLLACALRSGAAPDAAVRLVSQAFPGAASAVMAPVSARLELGGDPAVIWSELAATGDLAPLARALGRAHRSGTSVVAAVERLADDLTRSARADVEDRARAVGVKAAVPLGLCLLPAFVLIGIVPLVAGLLGTIAW